MSDLISRQAAIEAIDEWGLLDGLSEGFAKEILADENKVPSAQQWIPCSERLPEENTIVLATTADFMYIVEFEVYSNGHVYWNEVNEYRSIEGVIAWMPLPPSFKKE